MSSESASSRQTRRMAAILTPLRAAESRRAIAVARAYLEPELTREGEQRFRVLGAELAITRPRAKRTPLVRRVDVLVVDYLNRRHLRLVVEKEQVVEVRELEGQPAFAPEEIDEAKSIASEAPGLRVLVGRRNVFVSPFMPGSCEPGARRIGLHFVLSRSGAPAIHVATAVVDLVEQRLIEYEVRPAGEVVGSRGGSRGRVR